MAWRISCGMIQRRCSAAVMLLVITGGCRGEPAAPSEPPKATTPAAGPSPATTKKDEPMPTTPAPTAAPEPLGPALAAEAVAPAFGRWWAAWSKEHLATHPLRATLDERVAAGGTVKAHACDELAAHAHERAPVGSAELLYGNPAALRGRTDRCWWLHHDGMMGPGLGAALASDGRVLVVWVVREG